MVKIISMENLDFTTIRTPLMPHHLSWYSVCHVSQNERVENILCVPNPVIRGPGLTTRWGLVIRGALKFHGRINDSSIRLASEEPAQAIPQDGEMVF